MDEVLISASLLKATKGNIAQALILKLLHKRDFAGATYKMFLAEYDPSLWGLFYKNDIAYLRSLRDLRDVKGVLDGGNGKWVLSLKGKEIRF